MPAARAMSSVRVARRPFAMKSPAAARAISKRVAALRRSVRDAPSKSCVVRPGDAPLVRLVPVTNGRLCRCGTICHPGRPGVQVRGAPSTCPCPQRAGKGRAPAPGGSGAGARLEESRRRGECVGTRLWRARTVRPGPCLMRDPEVLCPGSGVLKRRNSAKSHDGACGARPRPSRAPNATARAGVRPRPHAEMAHAPWATAHRTDRSPATKHPTGP